ncbi:MAG TPA: TRAP transporter substrate-binding protein DctP [Syntrophales bacterium]|nr:TRAP transporter substrate-binding protein DctP [Syntrophales bacterium]
MRIHNDTLQFKLGYDRKFGRAFLLCSLLLLIVLLWPPAVEAAAPQFEIKLATLAPENSSLMQVFHEMNEELLKETGGKVGFKIFSGFVLGDEEDVLRKLRVGMVHAATFTGPALTNINPGMRVLQIPFLFSNYLEVDYVMGRIDGDLKRGFSERGLEILGWSELGFLYYMSTTPVANLGDVKGKKVWSRSNAPMLDAIMQKAGVSPVAINAPDVLIALQTNLVQVVYNSPYYALVTQWNTQIKYITDLPIAYIGGALVMDKKIFARMPAPLQEKMKVVCGKHMRRLTERTRKDNADALDIILKRGVKKIVPTAGDVEGFKDLGTRAMADLGPKYFPQEIFSKVKAALAEYRAVSQLKK